ncbi:substrate-binding domain-containing protein, partial [Streptomyces durbertensis]
PALLAPEGTSEWATALRDTATTWADAHRTPIEVRTVPFAATVDDAERATRALLDADPAIDAVICAPDGAAPGTLRAATALGRTPGTDLLIASCVDSAATRHAAPPITAVDLHPTAYGRACAELLCDVLAARTTPDT